MRERTGREPMRETLLAGPRQSEMLTSPLRPDVQPVVPPGH
jgi:hypothetical protein